MAQIDDGKKLFRQALGAFATGVTIVTTCDVDGNPVGLTANSFNSVSLDPPMVLWSLALDSRALAAFRQAEYWVVHILSKSQQDISNLFASRGADKFANLDYSKGPGSVPLLNNYAARFVCKATVEYEGGDHAIFVGEVVEHDQQPEDPLLFHSGKYARIMPSLPPPVPADLSDEGEFSRHFLGHILGLVHTIAMQGIREKCRERGIKSSEYTVIASLGLGSDCTLDELTSRVRNAGIDLPAKAIDALLQKGLIRASDQRLQLTDEGRTVLIELVAIAQASQLQMESRLEPNELGMLYALLQKLASA